MRQDNGVAAHRLGSFRVAAGDKHRTGTHAARVADGTTGTTAADPGATRFVPRHRRKLPAGTSAHEKTLTHYISHHLIAKQAHFRLPADFFERLLNNGHNVLLLLDGLDEVADEGERAQVREAVEELVRSRDSMRTVVTCRSVAYRNGRTALGAGFREVAVQPLDFKQHIVPMVRQAYACIYPYDAGLRDERADELLAGIARLDEERHARLGDDTGALVSSPLMVRLLLIVHMNNRRLPEERADLFDKAVNALLQVDYGRDESDINELSADWEQFRDMAQHLAWHMHCQGADQGREIDERALKAALHQEADFTQHVNAFLAHARQRGSVIEERDGIYRFIHLAFQEFLVARHLREIVGAESREALLASLGSRLSDPWWREPILLLVGYRARQAKKPAEELLVALGAAGATADEKFFAAELAGSAALEMGIVGQAAKVACAWRIVTLLTDGDALCKSKAAVRTRAGDVLAELGDLRFDPQHFHLPAEDALGYVRIAADTTFRIGTRAADRKRVEKIIGTDVKDDEINDNLSPTPEFYIGRYPVTVAQFRAFVDLAGFVPGDADALRDQDSRPVRYVSWDEATTYCAWLNEMLASSPLLTNHPVAQLVREAGWRVALPSELEWEKAACGGLVDTIFPWGSAQDPERANCFESGVSNTSVVGCFAANGYGLHDMSGNVWEWTRSVNHAYPFQIAEPQSEVPNVVRRIVRGGAWDFAAGFVRCAYRGSFMLSDRHDDLGFRTVLSSTYVS